MLCVPIFFTTASFVRDPPHIGRRAALASLAFSSVPLLPSRANAAAEKQRGLSATEIASIVAADVRDRQFLVTGALTRSIYDESCTFQDEIDTYTMDKYIKGTSALVSCAMPSCDLCID